MDEMMIVVEVQCPMCGEINALPVPLDGYQAWQNGELVQNAFPMLTPDERELLISGICHNCWERMFGVEDEF